MDYASRVALVDAVLSGMTASAVVLIPSAVACYVGGIHLGAVVALVLVGAVAAGVWLGRVTK